LFWAHIWRSYFTAGWIYFQGYPPHTLWQECFLHRRGAAVAAAILRQTSNHGAYSNLGSPLSCADYKDASNGCSTNKTTVPYPPYPRRPHAHEQKSTHLGASSSPTLPPGHKWNWDWCSRPVSAIPADRVNSLLSKFDEALSCSFSAAGGGGGWGGRGSRSVVRSSNPTTAAAAAAKPRPAASAAPPQAAPGAAGAMAAGSASADEDASETRSVPAAEPFGVPTAAVAVKGKGGRGGSKKEAAAMTEDEKADGNALAVRRDGVKPSRPVHVSSGFREHGRSLRVWRARVRCRRSLAACFLPICCVPTSLVCTMINIFAERVCL